MRIGIWTSWGVGGGGGGVLFSILLLAVDLKKSDPFDLTYLISVFETFQCFLLLFGQHKRGTEMIVIRETVSQE
jgi:hypothetical protein